MRLVSAKAVKVLYILPGVARVTDDEELCSCLQSGLHCLPDPNNVVEGHVLDSTANMGGKVRGAKVFGFEGTSENP